jgi:hypothetical protein
MLSQVKPLAWPGRVCEGGRSRGAGACVGLRHGGRAEDRPDCRRIPGKTCPAGLMEREKTWGIQAEHGSANSE